MFPFTTGASHAQSFNCNSGTCSYTGHIAQAAVNDQGQIFVYFSGIDPAQIISLVTSGGPDLVTVFEAAIISISENPDFAKYFYSTALAAKALNKQVLMEMPDSLDGYLKASRIVILNE